jgi:serine phosphatase RsbU (regulator of sigma subunit)
MPPGKLPNEGNSLMADSVTLARTITFATARTPVPALRKLFCYKRINPADGGSVYYTSLVLTGAQGELLMSRITHALRLTDPMGSNVRESMLAKLRAVRKRVSLLPFLRQHVGSNGPAWLPVVLVLGAFGAVAYADHRVVGISLAYFYIFPVSVSAIFLRSEVSYSFGVVCILFHDYYSPRPIDLGLRAFDNLSALLCFTFVVYIIGRYIEQREALAKTVQQQRNDFLQDVELATQVQRLFLPLGKPSIPGLEIASMMQPSRGVSGDYYDYIPIDTHTLQVVIADVAGKGVSAALLMSATAAVMQLEANHDRNMLEILRRLNTGIHSVSDGSRYVTLLLAEIDARERKLRYVNSGHNPALLFRAETGTFAHMNSSCPPIGMFPQEICELISTDLIPGDVLVFYTDGVTEAEDPSGEEFGMERLSTVVRRGSLLTAEELLVDIFRSAENFCGGAGFHDDVTILVVKCNFDGP